MGFVCVHRYVFCVCEHGSSSVLCCGVWSTVIRTSSFFVRGNGCNKAYDKGQGCVCVCVLPFPGCFWGGKCKIHVRIRPGRRCDRQPGVMNKDYLISFVFSRPALLGLYSDIIQNVKCASSS